MGIIDLETRIDDDSSVSNGNSHATGFISAFFDSMARATKKFTSTTKSKVVPHNEESHDSRPHSRKSHRDQSPSLRLRGSGSRKHKSRRDEELGGEDKSGFLDYIVEDDEGTYSDDNGTAFGVVAEPTRSSKSRRDKHHNTSSSKNHDEYHRKESNGSSSKPKGSPLQRKLSCESEDKKKHRNHHHRSSHNHHHNSHPHHHTEHRKSSH